MEYPKINSLYKRQFTYHDEKTGEIRYLDKGKSGNPFIEGEYAQEEFRCIKTWHVTEKIDGTNIRIFFEEGKVSFGGRTKDAQLPCHLLTYLQNHFTIDRLAENFKGNNVRAILFGEGYGPKIQGCGGNYRGDPGFILFDVFVNGWWLQQVDVEHMAHDMEIPYVPNLGFMSTEEIVEFVKSKPLSQCSRNPQMMEGVVCRCEPLMMTRSGKPVMMKLKCKDFQ